MKRFITLIITLLSFNIQAEDKIITLGADPWCPWNCVGNDQGIAVESAKAIFEPLGYKVQYIQTPWTRAMKDCADGKLTGVIGADRVTPELKSFIFPDSKLITSNNSYVVIASSDFKVSDANSLKGKIIGIVKDYHFDGVLGKFIDDHYQDSTIISQIGGDDAAVVNLRKLVNKRIDLYIDDEYVIQYNAKQENIYDKIKTINDGTTDDTYIAFSPKLENSKELAKIYDEGMKRIKSDGTYEKILAKYHISK